MVMLGTTSVTSHNRDVRFREWSAKYKIKTIMSYVDGSCLEFNIELHFWFNNGSPG